MSLLSEDSALRGRFLAWLAAGRIVHALALCQPDAEARAVTLGFFARALLCTSPSPPCNTCTGCKLAVSGNHPDDLLLAPDHKGVGDVRALLAELGARRWMGGWRPVRITHADSLTPQAQNALLKTLEEPPEGTVFLLGSGSAELLLPTIRSRCLILHASGAPDPSAADAQAALSLLSPHAPTRASAVHTIRSVTVLDALENLLMHEVKAREPGGASAPEANKALDRFTFPELLDMIGEVQQARRRVARNVAWPMALEGLLLCMGESFSS